jgi:hypothetical protein
MGGVVASLCLALLISVHHLQDYYVHDRLFDAVKDYTNINPSQLEWEESYEVRGARRQLINSTNVVFRILAADGREATRLAQQLYRGQSENAFGRYLQSFGLDGPGALAYKPRAYNTLGLQMCDDVLYDCIQQTINTGNGTILKAREETTLDMMTLGLALGLTLGILSLSLCCCWLCIAKNEKMKFIYEAYRKQIDMFQERQREIIIEEKRQKRRAAWSGMRTQFESASVMQPKAYTTTTLNFESVMKRLRGITQGDDDVLNEPTTKEQVDMLLNDAVKAQVITGERNSGPVNFNHLKSDAHDQSVTLLHSPRRSITQIARDIREALEQRTKDKFDLQYTDDAGNANMAEKTPGSSHQENLANLEAEMPPKHVWSTEALLGYDHETTRSLASNVQSPRLEMIDTHLVFLKEQLEVQNQELSMLSSPSKSLDVSHKSLEEDAYAKYLQKGMDSHR